MFCMLYQCSLHNLVTYSMDLELFNEFWRLGSSPVLDSPVLECEAQITLKIKKYFLIKNNLKSIPLKNVKGHMSSSKPVLDSSGEDSCSLLAYSPCLKVYSIFP
ncbi:hypothetical protein Lalb_Chr22g0359821 [Lupinus albus]|uniref:Uncharacterized protein n=1 Tax=Lupinus albus TaxID=3870 RepID=A0A6A4NQI2_LUPAL|nr:hypothetical protein Lalb_Chr22g0359821 [Lupinus albus]